MNKRVTKKRMGMRHLRLTPSWVVMHQRDTGRMPWRWRAQVRLAREERRAAQREGVCLACRREKAAGVEAFELAMRNVHEFHGTDCEAYPF